MANYLLNYMGIYRVLPQLDENTNDFVRESDGSLCDTDYYIPCQYGNMITLYGHKNGSRVVWLNAYIPSKGRGHNILKALEEENIKVEDIEENDEEVLFNFKSSDIDIVATLLKAKVSGANIRPSSTKNLPKSPYELSLEKIKEYKEITSLVDSGNLLLISTITNGFLDDILQKSLVKSDNNFDYKSDIKKKCMARQKKEYIDSMGYWNQYIKYLDDKVKKYYKES